MTARHSARDVMVAVAGRLADHARGGFGGGTAIDGWWYCYDRRGVYVAETPSARDHPELFIPWDQLALYRDGGPPEQGRLL